MFTCTVDRNDTTVTPYFIAKLKAYIDYQQHKEHDFDEEPRLQAFEGIKAQDAILEDEDDGETKLVDLDDDDELDDVDTMRSMQHVTDFWRPENGDLSILTTGIAAEIASLAQCGLAAEPAEKRVRVYNGDFQMAVRKLKNLEPLIVSVQ